MENKIHPTAELPEGIKLEGCIIGPWCIIEEGASIGKNNFLRRGVTIRKGSIIGDHNEIGENAVIGSDPQDLGFDRSKNTGVIIGNNNIIRESCNIHRSTTEGSPTSIGDHCYLMAHAHMGHDSKIEDEVILVNGCLLGGHTIVGRGAFISGNTALHQLTRVGERAIVGGLTKVTQDILPYTSADGRPAEYLGINAVGLRRAGFSPEDRLEIKRIYKIIYSRQSLKESIKKVEKEFPESQHAKNILDFIRSSKRGILQTVHGEK